jgi:hypothetical protein
VNGFISLFPAFFDESVEFLRISVPGDGAAALAHSRGGFDIAVFKGPEFCVFGTEIDFAGALEVTFDEMIVTADGTGGADTLGFVFTPMDLDGVIKIFFQEAGGVADFTKGDGTVFHPAIQSGFTDVQVFSRLLD